MLKSAYVAIPKTASRTIVSMTPCVYSEMHQTYNQLRHKDFEYIFTSVRNPYDRLVSAFCFLRRRHRQIPIDRPLRPPMNMNRMRRPNIMRWELLEDNRHMEFGEFVYMWLTDFVDDEVNCMFQPQTCWTKGVKYNSIIKMENFERDFAATYANIYQEEFTGEFKRINATKREQYQTYYTDTAVKDVVAEYYAADLESLRYSFHDGEATREGVEETCCGGNVF